MAACRDDNARFIRWFRYLTPNAIKEDKRRPDATIKVVGTPAEGDTKLKLELPGKMQSAEIDLNVKSL